MIQIITINSINYDGELANVLFTPDNDSVVINLGVARVVEAEGDRVTCVVCKNVVLDNVGEGAKLNHH